MRGDPTLEGGLLRDIWYYQSCNDFIPTGPTLICSNLSHINTMMLNLCKSTKSSFRESTFSFVSRSILC
eukprot:UN10071